VSEHVDLSIPASPEYLSLARLHVGAIASRMDMTIDELEDLQLAVEELCLTLLEPDHSVGARLDVAVTWADDVVEVSCTLHGDGSQGPPGTPDPQLDSLSWRILDALVDEHGATLDEGVRAAWLRKRRERRDAGR